MRRGARGFRKATRTATGGGHLEKVGVRGRLPSEPGRVGTAGNSPGAGVSVSAVDSIA